jgi:hypothetical protein
MYNNAIGMYLTYCVQWPFIRAIHEIDPPSAHVLVFDIQSINATHQGSRIPTFPSGHSPRSAQIVVSTQTVGSPKPSATQYPISRLSPSLEVSPLLVMD